MSESITIATGFPADDPWVIKDTDKNLQNLAIGTLASLSGEQGAAVKDQTSALSEVVAKVESINNRLNDLNDLSPISVFSLDVPAGLTKSNINLPLASSPTNDPIIRDLISLTQKLETNGINFGDYGAYTFNITNQLGKFSFLVQGPLEIFTGNANPVYATPQNGLSNGQLYGVSQPGMPIRYGIVGNGAPPELIDANSLKGVVIPEAKYEITQWENQKTDFSKAVSLYDSLTDTSVLVANTNPPNQKNNELTMAINIGVTNAVEVTYGTNKYYALLPIEELSPAPGRVEGVIYKGSDGIIRMSTNAGLPIRLDNLRDPPKYFILNPDKNQVNSWRSQYAEKQVILTQKASEQALFLNELVQKYNYFSDATTNVLKAFTNLKNQLINNL